MVTAAQTPAAARAVLDFWFGALDRQGMPSSATMRRWFKSDPAFDDEIRRRFGRDLQRIGQCREWRATAAGTLALVIVADQFSRNVYRGTARAFARDPFARELSLHAVDSGLERELRPIERMFLYLPLEHAEDRALQDRSVACFRRLADEVPAALRGRFEEFVRFAEGHREVIARFGRFPHRNAVLGRASTAAEAAWLESGGPAWGQPAAGQSAASRGGA